jgi:hypothetical protein
MGGIDKVKVTLSFIRELSKSFTPKALAVSKSIFTELAFLIVYDADSRGRTETVDKFVEKFSVEFPDLTDQVADDWIRLDRHSLSLLVLTDENGEYGVLEDTLLSLFAVNHAIHVKAFGRHMDKHFLSQPKNSEEIPYRTKKIKRV